MPNIPSGLFSKTTEADALFASGGIVVREIDDNIEIAVIEREKPYGDLTLPKGKLEENETFKQAAIREVKEEAFCEAHIVSLAGVTRYEKDGRPKIVLFWKMLLVKELEFKGTAEVKKRIWLTPKDAIDKLTHPSEKKLVVDVFGKPKWYRRFWLRITALFSPFKIKDLRLDRLTGSLAAYRLEVKRRLETATNKPDAQKLLALASQLLNAADWAVVKNDIDTGWKCFHAAQRMELYAMSDEELKTHAKILKNEAEKVGSWRQKAIEAIVNTDPKRETLYQAMLLIHEHFANAYYKIRLLQRQLAMLAVIFCVVVVIILYMACRASLPPLTRPPQGGFNMIIAVLLFGALGGTLSAFLSLIKTSTESTIPEQIGDWPITIMRVLVGAVSALAIYIVLNSDISSAVFNFEIKTSATILFVSFAAGFSEQLVQRAVKSVAEKKP